MKKHTILWILLFIVLLRVVHYVITHPNKPQDIVIDSSIQTWDIQEPLTNLSGNTTNEYTFFFSGTNEEQVTLYHRQGEATNIYFINSEAKAMKVDITFPGGSGNLRLAQIIMPDGSADGPFGQTTTYELNQYGWYQLIFHENMMAGDPRSGNVTIAVALQ